MSSTPRGPVLQRSASTASDASVSSNVAKHYNKIPNQGRQERNESPIFQLRCFNNWIKSMLISEALSEVRQHCRVNQPVILDIGFGKGGDLQKYNQGASIRHLIATDIAETSLQHARQRYNGMRGRRFSAEFFPADSTRERIRNKFSSRIMAHLVSVQFSFHYCFESLDQVKQMLLNISENLQVGGCFIGTTPDSYELVRRARQANSTAFGNDIFKVSFKNDSILDESKPPPLFGCTYTFTLDQQVVDCPEFLVYFPCLQEIALRFGLKLDFKRPFADFFLEKKYTDEGRNLLHRLRVFTKYDGTNTTGRPGDFDHADPYLKRMQSTTDSSGRTNTSVFTISRSEWEVITLYVVFKFTKVHNVSFQSARRHAEPHKRQRV